MRECLQELRSKRIYRVAAGYIFSAWVILQVAAIVSPSLELPSWTMKGVLDVLLLGFVPTLLLGWHLDLRRARAEGSSVLNKDAPVGPQRPSEQTLPGEGSAELDAKRQAKQIGLCGETPEKISVSRLPITGSDVFGREVENRYWSAELHRLRAVFLAALGAEETQIEASFGEGMRIAMEQKSVSLKKRAEGTYAEYRRQKASAPGGGIRLPL